MSIKHIYRLGALAAALALANTAHADAIVSNTSTITGSVITFNEFDGLITAGALDVGAGAGNDVLFTSVPNTVIGANNQDLQDNGLWGARGNPIDGLVDTPTGNGNFLATQFATPSGAINFYFANPVAQVGAFINQLQPYDTIDNFVTLIAYNQAGTVLETFSYSVDTPYDSYNEGMFLGIQRTGADIYGFGVANGSFVLDDLTYSVSAVPEPAAIAMLLGGLALIGARRPRKNA